MTNRRKPTHLERVLRILVYAKERESLLGKPIFVASTHLYDAIGPSARNRIGDLEKRGCIITHHVSQIAGYRLVWAPPTLLAEYGLDREVAA